LNHFTNSKLQLYNLIAQKESKLNLLMAGEQIRMAGEQKKLAIAAKRDTTTTKALSLLGTIFLPGAFLAVRDFHLSLFITNVARSQCSHLHSSTFGQPPILALSFPLDSGYTGPLLFPRQPSSLEHGTNGRNVEQGDINRKKRMWRKMWKLDGMRWRRS